MSHLQKIMAGILIVEHGMRKDVQAIDERLWKVANKVVDTQTLYDQIALDKPVCRHLIGVESN